MLFLAISILVVTSLSAFAAAHKDKKFEELLPMSVFSIILINYIFGLMGLLAYANILIYMIAAILWISTVVIIIKKKSYIQFIENMITPGSVAFVIIMTVFAYGLVGTRAIHWDEFSHWASSVKIMFFNDKLYSDPTLGANFGSYPPAMGLFQYSFMKIKGEWWDWILYYGYNFFVFSIFVTFFRKLKFKESVKIFCYVVTFVLLIKLLFRTAFTSLYVDLLLGLVFAYLMSAIICFDTTRDLVDNISFAMAVAVITLLKDAGTLFAAMAVFAFAICFIIENKARIKQLGKKELFVGLSPIIAFTFAKLSWKINIAVSGTFVKFGRPYDFKEFVSVVLGKDVGYRTSVWQDFITTFFTTFSQEDETIKINHGVYLFLVLIVLYIAITLFEKRYSDNNPKLMIVYYITVLTSLIYIVGIAASYMYKFTEYEASILASYGRYISILTSAILCMSIFVFIYAEAQQTKHVKIYLMAGVYLVAFMWNNNLFKEFLTRDYVKGACAAMQTQYNVGEKVNEEFTQNTKVAPIVLYNVGYNTWGTRYYVYPSKVGGEIPLSITTEKENDYETGGWSAKGDYTPQQLVEEFVEYDYNYLATIIVNERFISEYNSVFENPEDIRPGEVFVLNQSTGKFALVQ